MTSLAARAKVGLASNGTASEHLTQCTVRSPQDCVVCMDAARNVVLVPCGHVCCCKTCGEALDTCPICREHIEQALRMYNV